MLELAILGSLKEQPLHGYELKKRVAETIGPSAAMSFGSLYPALRRLERDGAIAVVDAGGTGAPIPATGSLSGDLAAARLRRGGKPSRRARKAYELTARGDERLRALLLDPDSPDDDRTFAMKLAFCGALDPAARLQLLQRRRANLADDLARARQQRPTPRDRYARSLVEHRTESVERDLEWVDSLIAAEGAEPSKNPNSSELGAAAS